MNAITVTVELCAEDRARLDAILAALQNGRKTPAPEPALAPAPTVEAETPNDTPGEQKAVAAAETPVEADTPTVEELQNWVGQAIEAGKKVEARRIIQLYGPRITAVPEDKRAEAIGLLKELVGG